MKKNNKINKKYSLVEALKEEVADAVSLGPQQEVERNDSLDQKFDSYLVSYEKESIPTSNATSTVPVPAPITEKKSLKSIMSFLFEAEGDEEVPAETPPSDIGGGGEDVPPPPTDDIAGIGGDDDAPAGEEKPTVIGPTINLNTFTRSVARLINNYEALMNPKYIMINRAKAYLEKNYTPTVAKQFIDMLDKEYDLSTQSFMDKEQSIESPYAAGALAPLDTTAPSGGGGFGGGEG